MAHAWTNSRQHSSSASALAHSHPPECVLNYLESFKCVEKNGQEEWPGIVIYIYIYRHIRHLYRIIETSLSASCWFFTYSGRVQRHCVIASYSVLYWALCIDVWHQTGAHVGHAASRDQSSIEECTRKPFLVLFGVPGGSDPLLLAHETCKSTCHLQLHLHCLQVSLLSTLVVRILHNPS